MPLHEKGGPPQASLLPPLKSTTLTAREFPTVIGLAVLARALPGALGLADDDPFGAGCTNLAFNCHSSKEGSY